MVSNCEYFCLELYMHATYATAGYVLSQFVKKIVDDYQAERDTKLRDYIIRHPELFPEPGNVLCFSPLLKRGD